MYRSIIAASEQLRSYDLVSFEKDVLLSVGNLAQDVLSQLALSATATTIVAGFAAVQSATPANLTINVGAGRIYTISSTDATAVGAIPQDLSTVVQQGQNPGQQITLTPPSTGQSQWNLIQVQFSQTDAVRSGDPNGGNVPFFNAANPSQPNFQSINTVRQSLAVLQVITGTATTTGAEVPPQPTVGWQPLYLIDLAGGQTQITTAQILTAGPSVGTNVPTNYPQAPFLAGFLKSHHLGIAGHAPKIDLTREVSGVLPYANMSPTPQLLNGPLTLYVNGTTGADTNTGTAPGSAFKTIQAAMNSAFHNYNFNGYALTVSVANGTYTNAVSAPVVGLNSAPLGCSGISITGNTASPGSVAITATNGQGFLVINCPVTCNIQGFTITATGFGQGQGSAVASFSGSLVNVANLVCGSCAQIQMVASTAGSITLSGPITLTGVTQFAIAAEDSGFINFSGNVVTVTGLTCTQAFAIAFGTATLSAQSQTWVGTFVGVRYRASGLGLVFTNGAGANYFPGSSPGTTDTGGVYA